MNTRGIRRRPFLPYRKTDYSLMVQQGIKSDSGRPRQPRRVHMGPNQSSSIMGVRHSSSWMATFVPIHDDTRWTREISESLSGLMVWNHLGIHTPSQDLLPTVRTAIMKSPDGNHWHMLLSTCPSFDGRSNLSMSSHARGHGPCWWEYISLPKCQHSGARCAQLYESRFTEKNWAQTEQ